MKKYFYIGIVLMALTSCGSSETRNHKVEDMGAPDTFGMEMPIEALESTTPYQGTGNMSDGADQK